MKQCLMIETKDHKKFFTYEKNLPYLIQFSKTFNAEISKVQIPSEAEVLELEQLAPALCEKKSQNVDYKILSMKLSSRTKRRKIISRAKKIQNYIQDRLLTGEVVSLSELSHKFRDLTSACLCNHFKLTRDAMIKEGHKFVKIGGGKYRKE